ncbi:LOW QUALITY PROTEIN: BCL2/adenovirus E1B 19 kDa protein-interacting protein 3-like [Pterocles gutturalis]
MARAGDDGSWVELRCAPGGLDPEPSQLSSCHADVERMLLEAQLETESGDGEFAFVCPPQPVLWSLQGGAVGRKKRVFSSELLLLFIPSLLLSHLLTLGLGIYIGKQLAASSANPL